MTRPGGRLRCAIGPVMVAAFCGVGGCIDMPGDRDRAPTLDVAAVTQNPHTRTSPCIVRAIGADPDGDDLTYQVKIASGEDSVELAWSTYHPDGEELYFAFVMDPGEYRIGLRCRDSMNRMTPYSQDLPIIFESEPPFVPARPAGDTLLFVPAAAEYRSRTEDIEGDLISFRFDPGGGEVPSEWSELLSSPADYVFTRAYAAPGIYNLRVQAKDASGHLSGWSDPLQVMARPNVKQVGSLGFGGLPVDGVVVADGYAYVTVFAGGLRIVDVHVPDAPALVGSADGSFASGVIARGPHGILLLSRENLVNYDVREPGSPHRTAETAIAGSRGFSVRGDLAAVVTADPSRGIVLADLGRPDTLIVLGELPVASARAVCLGDGYAYLTAEAPGGGRFLVVDVREPRSPRIAATLTIDRPGPVWSEGGGYAYFISNLSLKVVNVGVPSDPQLIRELQVHGIPAALDGAGLRLAVTEGLGGFELFDLSFPERPELIARWDPPEATVQRMWCGEDHLYAANFFRDLRVFEYPPPFPPSPLAEGGGSAAGAPGQSFRLGNRGGRVWLAPR